MPRARRSVAVVCVAVILLVALVPGLGVLDYAWLEPQWVLLVEHTPPAIVLDVPAPVEQPQRLDARLVSRGPPALPHL